MTGHITTLKGFRLDKDDKRVARDSRRLNVSARLKAKGRERWAAASRDWQRPLGRGDGDDGGPPHAA
jgi:hypothetical protein